jgi:hypothetical protein
MKATNISCIPRIRGPVPVLAFRIQHPVLTSYLCVVTGGRHRIQDSLRLLTGFVYGCGTKAHQACSEKQISEGVGEEDVAIETPHVPADNRHVVYSHVL